MSFVTVYLNSLSGLHQSLPPDKKQQFEQHIREWLVSSFQSDLDQKVARTLSTGDFGPLPLHHQFVKFMSELFQVFIYGQYYSAIALAGVTAERFCIDLLLVAEIKVDGRRLSVEEKQAITEMCFHDIIELLRKWEVIQEATKMNLHEIRRTRNRYVHLAHPPFPTAKSECERLIKTLCEIARTEFGPGGTGRYVIDDGAIRLRPNKSA